MHTLPAVAALGRAHPNAEIHWAVEERFAALVANNPFVNRLIRLDTLGWRRSPTAAGTMADIMQGFAALREYPYDAAIDFQGLMKSAILARLTHSQKRIGLSSKFLRESLAALLYNCRVTPQNCTHVIEINLSLVECLGARPTAWEFPLPDNPQDKDVVREKLQAMGTGDFIIINFGGGWKSKRWSPENYAELINRLAGMVPYDFLVTGSLKEEETACEILARANVPRARWFPSTLLQFIALAREARLLIGGDTGPLHLAAAAGTPIVAIFNSNDPRNTPERNGPFNREDIILCGPGQPGCTNHDKHLNYLEGVGVNAVAAAVIQRLGTHHG